MANTITRQVIMGDSTSHRYVVLFTIIGDGSGEETGTLLHVTGALGLNPKLVKLDGACAGFSGRLLWDATTDVVVQQLPSDHEFHFDYCKLGGILNFAGSGKTGDLLITTSGLGNGDSGTILLEFIRD